MILHPRVFGPLMTRLLRRFKVDAIEPLPLRTMGGLLAFYCATWIVGGLGLYFVISSVGAHRA